MRSRRLLELGGTIAAAVLVAGTTFGQVQDKDQQGCINTVNKDIAKVAATQGKENSGCVKTGTKGAVAANCPTADAKGKVAKTTSKTTADETKKCTVAPNFAYTSGANANGAAKGSELDYLADIFGGTDLSGVISTDKLIGGCQSTVIKDAEKITATKWKEFIGCKKDALKNGAAAAAGIELCVTPGGIAADAKGKIGKTVSKLGADITKKCTGVTVATAFPGACSGSSLANLNTCIDQRAECRVCLAINDADGLNVNCDLFDNGAADGSCVVLGPPIGTHKCTLAGTSAIDIKGALPLPPLPAAGAIDINCGGTNPSTGKAACSCSVQAPGFAGLNIAGLFWACVKPAVSGVCPAGEIDCDGGNALGLVLNGKRNVGPCTGNADCTTQCATFCGGAANVFGGAGQCEGFCTDGAQAACTTDAQCAGLSQGSCSGPDGVGLGNVCDCNCLNDAAGGPSAAGTLQCQLAFNLTVEPMPGNGMTCDGADVSINVGDTCAPLSTQSSSSTLVNLNNGGTTIGPFADTGAAANCATLAGSNTSGVSLVGSTIFYASTIGDLDTLLAVDCQ